MGTAKRLLFLVCIAVVIFAIASAALGGLAALFYYGIIDIRTVPGLAALTQTAPPPPDHALTDVGGYKTENNWIAAKTGEEIAAYAWLAVHPDQPVPALKVKATVDTLKGHVHLELSGWSPMVVAADLTPAYAWDAASYADFARQLLGDQKAAEPAGTDASDLLTDLLIPTGGTLADKDVEISRALAQNPASAQAHEKAALLLLTLGLRENACELSDTRIAMCRACAHLAVARALEGGDPASWVGKVADAALVTLSGREADALPRLDALAGQANAPPAVQTWIQALRVFNKNDWRIVSPDTNSPLLLRIAWIQSVADNLGDSLAMSYLDRLGTLEEVPDWGRAMLSTGDDTSVDVGHRFCESTMQLEFKELKTVLEAEGETSASNVPLRGVFKNPVGPSVAAGPDGKNTVHVVGLDLFEDIAERHLFFEAWKTHFWLKNSWGVPDQDAQFVTQMRSLFSGVRHEQYLDVFLASPRAEAFPASGRLQDDVADIPPSFAFRLIWPENACALLVPYFGWGVPFGAPFDMKARCTVTYNARLSHHQPDPNAPSFRDLLPLAPDSYILASWIILLAKDQHVTMAEKDERALLEPFFDYNANALAYFRSLANGQSDFDDATQEDILRKEAALDPDEFYNLGNFLLAHGKADEATDAYRKGVQQGNDQVLFANSIKPLVQYDFEHNQQDEALLLAKRAADVYSKRGLETYIWLLCKMNRGPDAEVVAHEIEDRYGDDYLTEFYAGHPDLFPDQYANAVKSLFPDGMQDVTLASFADPPRDGCQFTTSSDALETAQLHVGDVVVALDGHAVHSEKTYRFIRAMSDDPTLDLIVWRGGHYFESKASPPDRRFGNEIGDYHP